MSFVNVENPCIPEDSGAVYHLVCDGTKFYDAKGNGAHTNLGTKPVILPKDTIAGYPAGFQVAGFLQANSFTYPSSHVLNFAAGTAFTVVAITGPYGGADNGVISADDTTSGWSVDWLTGNARFWVRSATTPTIVIAGTTGKTDGLNVFIGGYDGAKPVLRFNGNYVAGANGSMGQNAGTVKLGARQAGLPCLTTIHEIYVTKVTPTPASTLALWKAIAPAIGFSS